MDNEDLFHLAIAVPVILPEIYLLVNDSHGLCDHFCRVLVVAVCVVPTVVGEGLAYGDGSDDVEIEFELSVACVEEVVAYGADVYFVGISCFVEETAEGCVGISEGHVGELHEDDESAFAAHNFVLRLLPFCGFAFAPCRLSASASCLPAVLYVVGFDVMGNAQGIALQEASVVGPEEVEHFVAHHCCRDV